MKNKRLFVNLMFGLTFCLGASLVSCNTQNDTHEDTPEVINKAYLEVNTDDMKLNYLEGETFDPSGLVVKKVVKENGIVITKEVIDASVYKLSIPSGSILKLQDKEVIVSVTDNNIQSGKIKIHVREKHPSLNERFDDLKKSTGYRAIASGYVTTQQFDISEDGEFYPVMVDTYFERVYDFTPYGYSSSYVFPDINGNLREIKTSLINLGDEENPDGVVVYETDPDTDKFVNLGKVPAKYLKNYQERIFGFEDFLITDPKNPNPDRLALFDRDSYVFDLTVDDEGKENNAYDTVNRMILGKTLQLGSLADLITGVRLQSTSRGLKYVINIENTLGTYDTPVKGVLEVEIVETELNDLYDLKEETLSLPVKEKKLNPDYEAFMKLASENSYSIRMHSDGIPGKDPAANIDITYGTNYFAISVATDEETPVVIDGFISIICEDGSVEQAQFVPEKEGSTTKVFKKVAKLTPEMLEELNIETNDFLELVAVSNSNGVGFLKNRPDFDPTVALFASDLEPVFRDRPPCFIVNDRFGYLQLNEYLDYTSAMMPISYTDPNQIAGSVLFWDKGPTPDKVDDEITCGMLQNNMLAGWMPVSFSRFGIENIVVDMFKELPPFELPPEAGEDGGLPPAEKTVSAFMN